MTTPTKAARPAHWPPAGEVEVQPLADRAPRPASDGPVLTWPEVECGCCFCERKRATSPPADLLELGHPSYHLPAMLEDVYRGFWRVNRGTAVDVQLAHAARLATGEE